MGKSVSAFCLVFLLNFSVVNAQVPDIFGLYFSPGTTDYCRPNGIGQVHDISIVLHNPSGQTAIAWEGTLSVSGDVILVGHSISGSGLNFATFPEFKVGLGSPMILEEATVFAEVRLYSLGSGGLELVGMESDYPVYLAGGEEETRRMTPAIGGFGSPNIIVGNLDCPIVHNSLGWQVPVHPSNWCSIKALYR